MIKICFQVLFFTIAVSFAHSAPTVRELLQVDQIHDLIEKNDCSSAETLARKISAQISKTDTKMEQIYAIHNLSTVSLKCQHYSASRKQSERVLELLRSSQAKESGFTAAAIAQFMKISALSRGEVKISDEFKKSYFTNNALVQVQKILGAESPSTFETLKTSGLFFSNTDMISLFALETDFIKVTKVIDGKLHAQYIVKYQIGSAKIQWSGPYLPTAANAHEGTVYLAFNRKQPGADTAAEDSDMLAGFSIGMTRDQTAKVSRDVILEKCSYPGVKFCATRRDRWVFGKTAQVVAKFAEGTDKISQILVQFNGLGENPDDCDSKFLDLVSSCTQMFGPPTSKERSGPSWRINVAGITLVNLTNVCGSRFAVIALSGEQ